MDSYFEDLKKEIPYLLDSSGLDWDGINQKKYLYRGINKMELEQLLKDGPDSFIVHKGTGWEPKPHENVKFWAGAGYSTSIVVEVKRDSQHFTSKNFEVFTQEACIETFKTQIRAYYYQSLPD